MGRVSTLFRGEARKWGTLGFLTRPQTEREVHTSFQAQEDRASGRPSTREAGTHGERSEQGAGVGSYLRKEVLCIEFGGRKSKMGLTSAFQSLMHFKPTVVKG